METQKRLQLIDMVQLQLPKIKNLKGQSLIEVLIVISILGIILPALVVGFVAAREGKPSEEQRLDAISQIKECQEAVRSSREKSWNTFAIDGIYHPIISGSAFSLSSGTDIFNGLTRNISISSVYRDIGGTVVSTGGYLDPATKKIDYTISWSSPLSKSITHTEYLTRYIGNTAPVQTSQSQFNNGTFNSTVSANVSGGEVKLNQSYTWKHPVRISTYNIPGNGNANDIFISGNYAYVGANNSASFTILDITNSTPVFVSQIGLGTTVNGIYVQGNNAYVATRHTTREVQIINITNKNSPTVSSTIDLSGSAPANTVFANGNTLYVGKDSSSSRELFLVDISGSTTPYVSGSLEIGGNVNSIYATGNYAYLTTNIGGSQIIGVNTQSNTSPYLSGSTSLGTDYVDATPQIGSDLFGSGNTLYSVSDNHYGCDPEFNILSVSNSSITLVGSLDVSGDLNGVYVSSPYAFFAIDHGSAEEFYVANISTPSAPKRVGNLSLSAGGIGTDIVVKGDYAYMTSTRDSSEIEVITKQTDVYYSSGDFISSTIDAGSSAAFNYIDFSVTEPSGTDIKFQVSTNFDNNTWNYVGPNGTASTYYDIPAAIPINIASGRYFRYKAFLTGNSSGTLTPQLYSFTVNYSP